MHKETEGFVLRQVKTLNNRRMILLFSKEYGKISAGTSVSEKSKTKSALAMRPFTLSRFELTESRGYTNIKDADTIKSYYKIGEDLNKFANASYVLEFTEKLRPEEDGLQYKQSRLFPLLTEYMGLLEERKKSYGTLTLAFLIKAIQVSGVAPQLKTCIRCGEANIPAFFNVGEAGFICDTCAGIHNNNGDNSLLYKVNFDIVNVLNFLMANPIERVRSLELKPELTGKLMEIIKEYVAYHLDISNIKSESLLNI